MRTPLHLDVTNIRNRQWVMCNGLPVTGNQERECCTESAGAEPGVLHLKLQQ